MAKKNRRPDGLKISVEGAVYVDRCIVIDDTGMPWVIDPAKGTVSPAKIELPATEKRK